MSANRPSNGVARLVLIVLGVVLLLPLLMMAFAMPMMGMMGWWWGDSMAVGLSPLWAVGMMLVWLLVIVGIGIILYRGVVETVGPSVPTDPALEELRVAYARGDLSTEEFEDRRERLEREG